MIKFNDALGQAVLTNEYFVGIVSEAIKSCYGVAGMTASDYKDTLMSAVFGADYQRKGVTVTEEDGSLVIGLHVKIMYGISVRVIADNIRERVRYAVENATKLKVSKINVYVDDIVTE